MNWNDIEWCCAIKRKNNQNMYTPIKNPWWGWAADPFLVEADGVTYVFAELWNYFFQKGSIGYIEITDGHVGEWKIAIREWYHMSYPFIWRDEKGYHICAETSRIKQTYCYDAVVFPKKWRKSKIYNTGLNLADTTFLFDENMNIKIAFSYLIEGNLGKLISLDTSWNGRYSVLSEDLHNARMAGAIIKQKREKYRLAQICDESYGKGICVNRIVNEKPYQEELMKEVFFSNKICKSKYDIIGMHTYNQSDEYEVIDLRYHHFNSMNFICFYLIKAINFVARNLINILHLNKI